MTLWSLVLLPLVGALIVARASRRAGAIAAAVLAAVAAVGAFAAASQPAAVVSWGPRLQLSVAATGFAAVMVVLVPVIALPIVLYAAVTETAGRARLLALLTAFVGAMQLLVVANDLLTLLIGWELVGAFSWVLIAHGRRDPTNAQKASHAFLTTRFGDLGLYVAAGAAFASTGSFAFADLSDSGPASLQVIAAGMLLAAAAKSAQVPFSPWLFSAMAGPTAVSALLHSSTMVAAGAYLLIRLGPHLNAVDWFAPVAIAIGLTSALAGGIVASVQRDPKRLLAASTTAQYGLMFVAVGAGSALAAGAQLVAHAAFKSLLFLTAGVAIHTAASDDLADMRLGNRIPVTAAFGSVGALALAAVPPLGAAWSKEQIVAAGFEVSVPVAVGVLVAGALSAFYGFRYWLLAFGPTRGDDRESTPARARASMAFLAALSVGLGILWLPSVNEAAARLVAGGVVHDGAVALVLGLASAAVAAGLVVALERASRLAHPVAHPAFAGVAAAWFGIGGVSRRVVVDPVVSLSRGLAAFDDQVIDAGVRASGRIATAFSALLRRRSEVSIDAIVDGIGRATLALASGTRLTDDDGVDRAAETLARAIGRAGQLLRRLQTGLSHHYYVIVAVGIVVLLGALTLGTS